MLGGGSSSDSSFEYVLENLHRGVACSPVGCFIVVYLLTVPCHCVVTHAGTATFLRATPCVLLCDHYPGLCGEDLRLVNLHLQLATDVSVQYVSRERGLMLRLALILFTILVAQLTFLLAVDDLEEGCETLTGAMGSRYNFMSCCTCVRCGWSGGGCLTQRLRSCRGGMCGCGVPHLASILINCCAFVGL